MFMLIRKVIEKIIIRLGRKDYQIDKRISFIDLCLVIKKRFFQLVRGSFIKMFFKSADGFVFIGKNSNIMHASKISCGKTLILGNNVTIDALSISGINFGNNNTIQDNVIIECTGNINNLGNHLIFGNNVGIAHNCFIHVRGKVEVGSNVIIGPNVNIISENHNFSERNKYINEQGVTRIGVKIEDGVWIGTRSVILDGVTVGENSIIAAGSVVNKNVPKNSIYGGIPAKFLKSR